VTMMLRQLINEAQRKTIARTFAHVQTECIRLMHRWLGNLIGPVSTLEGGRAGHVSRQLMLDVNVDSTSTSNINSNNRRSNSFAAVHRQLETVSATDLSTEDAHMVIDLVLGRQAAFSTALETRGGLSFSRQRSAQAAGLELALAVAEEGMHGDTDTETGTGGAAGLSSHSRDRISMGTPSRDAVPSNMSLVERRTAAAVGLALERVLLCAIWRLAALICPRSQPDAVVVEAVATGLTKALRDIVDAMLIFQPLPLSSKREVGNDQYRSADSDDMSASDSLLENTPQDDLEKLEMALSERGLPNPAAAMFRGDHVGGKGNRDIDRRVRGPTAAAVHSRTSSCARVLLRCITQMRHGSLRRLWKAATQSFPCAEWRERELANGLLDREGQHAQTLMAPYGLQLAVGSTGRAAVTTRVSSATATTATTAGTTNLDPSTQPSGAAMQALSPSLSGAAMYMALSMAPMLVYESALIGHVVQDAVEILRETVFAGYLGTTKEGTAARLNRLLLLLTLQRHSLRELVGTYSVRSADGTNGWAYSDLIMHLVHARLLTLYDDLGAVLPRTKSEGQDLHATCAAEKEFLRREVGTFGVARTTSHSLIDSEKGYKLVGKETQILLLALK